MKFVEKVTLIIYSNLILILAVIACLIFAKVIDINVVQSIVRKGFEGDISSKVILGSSIVAILLSIRCIFFDPTSKQKQREKQGILLANDNGRLLISKETIENLVEAVTSEYDTARNVVSRVELDKSNNVNIYVNLVVSSDAIIRDLSIDLQNKIKSKIKEATDLDIKEVNINIKHAVPDKKEKVENKSEQA